jgi:hypothetical protein
MLNSRKAISGDKAEMMPAKVSHFSPLVAATSAYRHATSARRVMPLMRIGLPARC